ncbi:hypothetical protein CAPTEDRAFT_221877 [Capitella teleta]|uniref:RNA polymerase-associated protein LEO1 n=1 Tax=Capitella teleta TaxID=283909 RepID=R7UT86_CAPTE|nr:hypothetical protein CAPTEDRAFT_221877 [Capitella teleta]|eukprot:ELU09383.1 hypothetical protein CAPTEDRAFT_221877 [Capitella teleta]
MPQRLAHAVSAKTTLCLQQLKTSDLDLLLPSFLLLVHFFYQNVHNKFQEASHMQTARLPVDFTEVQDPAAMPVDHMPAVPLALRLAVPDRRLLVQGHLVHQAALEDNAVAVALLLRTVALNTVAVAAQALQVLREAEVGQDLAAMPRPDHVPGLDRDLVLDRQHIQGQAEVALHPLMARTALPRHTGPGLPLLKAHVPLPLMAHVPLLLTALVPLLLMVPVLLVLQAVRGSEDEAKRDVEEDMDTTAVDHATADDLFGDAGDITSDSEDEAKPRDEREDEREAVPVIQEEEEEEEVPETRIEVEIPKINTALGKNLYFVKLPNFLSVETRPFDPQVYEDEIDEDEVMDEEGRTRLKLKVENTIRWRTMKDDDGNDVLDEFGEPVRESNARYVRWSDGSMSMHLGNEIFDVHPMTLQGDFNHLFIRQGTGLQGQAVFKTKLTFRPHSTDSFTHRKMTMSMVDRSSKTQKVKVLPIAGKDPESQRSEMIKKEEERLRASIRRESQQRRIRERAHQRGLNPNYLEDDDDENGISLSAIKHKYKQSAKGGHRPNIYSSSSEDSSSDEEANRKRLLKAKKLDSDEESDGSDGEVKRKKAKVAASSDDEDSGDGAGKSGSGSGSGGSRSAASGSDSD